MRYLFFLLFALSVLAGEAASQHQQATARRLTTGGLSPNDVRTLKAAKLHCIVPTYLPAGMRFSRFEFEPATRAEPASYTFHYTGKGRAHLAVQMASEGIGSVLLQSDNDDVKEPSSLRTVRNAVLGKIEIQFLDLPKDHHFGVEWIDLGEHKSPRFLCVTGRHIASSEAVKIVKGLRFLK